MIKKYAIILCAGNGARANLGYNKILYPLGQKNVIETTLDKFTEFDGIIVAASKHDIAQISEMLKNKHGCLKVIEGGNTRTDSVKNSLAALKAMNASDSDIVLIHDGARPFITDSIINRVCSSVLKHGSGIACVKVIDSIKQVNICGSDITIKSGTNRNELYAAQTPQGFRLGDIIYAYANISGTFEDDSDVYRLAGFTPYVVEGEYGNKKLTSPSDFFNLGGSQSVGTGFDVHQLGAGRKLILGGVDIPYPLGLIGHSDADVLLHAVTDAVLSASGERDIGTLFPDTDIRYNGIDSSLLLKEAVKLTTAKGKRIKYISAVIIAQAPKMMPHIPLMRARICEIAGIDIENINISATTTEFMGIVGDNKAIAASCTCLCE